MSHPDEQPDDGGPRPGRRPPPPHGDPVGAARPAGSSVQAAPAIGDYAAIGDGRSVALISRAGSLDWLCWPRFDSDAVFAGLLDPGSGGHWSILPRGAAASTRRYLGRTNVLETRFETADGIVRVTDFMPIAAEAHARDHLLPEQELIRIVACDAGRVTLDVVFAPRPGFARHPARIVDRGRLGLRVGLGGESWCLHHDLAFAIADGTATARVTLAAGERRALVMTYASESPEVLPLLAQAPAALARTLAWWEEWSARMTYDGPYADAVRRSTLALKLLSFPTSGAFVAAATTSLPERLGGTKNWDYRYCWLRDAALIMEALCGTGYMAEAESFAEWLLHATRLTQPKLKVMYDVHGNPAPAERPLPDLAGFMGSRPVNVGNGARGQEQLDTYGEVIAAVAMLVRHLGRSDRETARVLAGFGRTICAQWQEADAGIWEVRDHDVVHTHSRLMCWVGLDALVRLDEQGLLDGCGRAAFRTVRERIREAIERDSWVEAEGTYTSEPGRTVLDATLLLLAVFAFEPATTARMRGTFQRVRRDLGAGGALLYRNRPAGHPVEGAFGICGFWGVEFLAKGGGTLAEARAAFEQLLVCGNDVGLFAEETDPATGALLGNFPQAFTHVGLINAAMAIQRRELGEPPAPTRRS